MLSLHFCVLITVCMYLQILRQSKIKLRYSAKFRGLKEIFAKFSRNRCKTNFVILRIWCVSQSDTKQNYAWSFVSRNRCETKFHNVFCFAKYEKFREIPYISHLLVISRNKISCEKWKLEINSIFRRNIEEGAASLLHCFYGRGQAGRAKTFWSNGKGKTAFSTPQFPSQFSKLNRTIDNFLNSTAL